MHSERSRTNCSNIESFGEDMLAKAFECKESIIEILEEEEQLIEGLILDSRASMGMSGVIAKIIDPYTWQHFCS